METLSVKTGTKSIFCSAASEIAFYDTGHEDLSQQDLKMLKIWSKRKHASVISIWIDKEKAGDYTVKSLLQLFLYLEKYNSRSRIIVQWRMNTFNTGLVRKAHSFKALFPNVCFIFKES